MPDESLVVLFLTIHDVMAAESMLAQLGMACELVPTPRPLSSECGMAIMLSPDDLQAFRAGAQERGIRVRGIYLKGGPGSTEWLPLEPSP